MSLTAALAKERWTDKSMPLLASKVPTRVAEETEALCIRDLSRVESFYGRLVYLTALRNPDTGRYEHYRFTAGSPGSLIAGLHLRRVHETIFMEWVGLSLAHKKADIELYVSGIDHADGTVLIDTWLRLTPYVNLVPASIQGPERQRHISDFQAILGLLRNIYGVALPD